MCPPPITIGILPAFIIEYTSWLTFWSISSTCFRWVFKDFSEFVNEWVSYKYVKSKCPKIRIVDAWVYSLLCMFKKDFMTWSHVFLAPGCPWFARTPISSLIPKRTNSIWGSAILSSKSFEFLRYWTSWWSFFSPVLFFCDSL